LTIKRFTEIRILKNIIDIWILERCTKICCIGKDNIKMDLQKVVCEVMGRIALAEDRDKWWALVNAVVKYY
jgi:hypothetical protein